LTPSNFLIRIRHYIDISSFELQYMLDDDKMINGNYIKLLYYSK